MVTYADVQGIYRSEKGSPTLQKIDDGFYSGLSQLLSGIDEEHREYIKKLAEEIFEKRRNKMVVNALRSPDKEPVNMAPVEKVFYAELTRTLAKYRGKVFSEKIRDEEEKLREEEDKRIKTEKIKVRFLHPLPSIIGSDLVHYGPFKEGDTVKLPKGNAVVLIDQEIAEEI